MYNNNKQKELDIKRKKQRDAKKRMQYFSEYELKILLLDDNINKKLILL